MTRGTSIARAREAARKRTTTSDAGEGGEVARGEGAEALAGVLAVGFEVEEVVDDVGGGGAEAEAEEGEGVRRRRGRGPRRGRGAEEGR